MNKSEPLAVSFGEVLFDCFDDQTCIGAGDAFSAALAAGVIVGTGPDRIVEVACAAGAAVVQHRGAQIELPDEVVSAFKMDEKEPG